MWHILLLCRSIAQQRLYYEEIRASRSACQRRLDQRRASICTHEGDMEQQLKDFVAGLATQNLTILYSDMHGLWGGITITLSTSGAYELLERGRGQVVPTMVRRTVTPARVQDVIRVLLEARAWEQMQLERTPLPDEVRATLTLRVGDLEASTWELYNKLEKNDRIVRVRRLLLKLADVAP
jgi:hypothetical protein